MRPVTVKFWRGYVLVSGVIIMALLVYIYRQPPDPNMDLQLHQVGYCLTCPETEAGLNIKNPPVWSESIPRPTATPGRVLPNLPRDRGRLDIKNPPVWSESIPNDLNVLRRDSVSYRLSNVDIDKMTDQQLLLTIHNILDNTDTVCTRKLRMGGLDYGGWEVCDDPDVSPEPPCIVYSFGIGWDYSFDDDISRVYGCHVFSFDPTMDTLDHERSKLVHFRNVCISEKTEVNEKGWKLFTLNDLKKKLGHEQQAIPVIKMDVETSEWLVLPEMVRSGAFIGVKQLLIEYHVDEIGRNYLLGNLKTIQAIEMLGFKKFYVHKNWHCKTNVNNFPVQRTRCYEVHYVHRP